MKIEPLGSIIRIEVEEVKAGNLNTSSRTSAIEFGTVVEMGDDVSIKLKVGDKVLFKSWGMDNTEYKGKKLYFINSKNESILAVVK